jgi:hypothetical protein
MNGALAPYRVRRKADVAFSIVIAGGEKERIPSRKRFHILYSGGQRVVRTMDIGTLVRGLVAELERSTFPDRDDAIYVQWPAIAMDGKVALVPETYQSTLARLGRRPERAGLRLPLERTIAVDPDTGRVIPIARRLEFPEDAVDRVTAMFGGKAGNGAPALAGIDRPVAPEVVIGHSPNGLPEEHMQPISRGRALHNMAYQTLNIEKLGVRALEGLGLLVEKADCYGFYAGSQTPQERTAMMTGLVDVLKR